MPVKHTGAAVPRARRGELHSSQLIQRIDGSSRWEDLALPAEQTAQLRALAGQVGGGSRGGRASAGARDGAGGQGVIALFVGASGTEKLRAARVLAGALGHNLYRIDLSTMASRYIGETEKNLSSVFSAAASGNVVMFFDEADALFGRRTDVRGSHDRYSNPDVSYLLQRMEGFHGLTILSTNMRSTIEQRFPGRFSNVVIFPHPTLVARTKM